MTKSADQRRKEVLSASPAVRFFADQNRSRTVVREQFRKKATKLLDAHQFFLSAVSLAINRHAGQKWPSQLSEETKAKAAQVAQLSMLFLQGVDLCEVAVAEGVYGQAAALIRQHLEVLGAIDEVWDGKRNPKCTPKISSLDEGLRRHYGVLSGIAHAAVPDYLDYLHTRHAGDLVGASLAPVFNERASLYLYRLEVACLFEFCQRQDTALGTAYGSGLNSEEQNLVDLGLFSCVEWDRENGQKIT
ncbi:hypothetical protein K3X44_04355 [Aliiroseovarius crassostreae]|uniref:Uncharacterized protein n=1 Tax=Aliiroseovarius crassostreae TaxID=154981 RepID=A0A9Q9HE70_9RHOB|nr:hypothetical protein [Aliiroseovarius crassostreae]UWP96221.1 hypothetical protein K3X48_04320 [Aliiroseovarius crassostreae]UWQ02576.1 hypothetical protein K3X44_04355 [Aliiroseovarius crassostreae]